jgi:thiosulfate/3-mercaptopyruvate sulfurtransferase
MRRWAGLLALTGLALAIGCAQSRPEAPQLISTAQLAQRLNDPNLRIIDARGALATYLQEHLPNALFLSTETLRLTRGGIPGQLLPPERLAEIFGAMGIGAENEVVVYSSAEDAFSAATYTALALLAIGHTRVAVLDGGFEKWKAESRPLSRAIPRFEPQTRTAQPNPDLFRTLEWLQKYLDSPEPVQVLDARAPQQYQAGHIPTAQNLFLRDLLRSEGGYSVWRSPDEIRDTVRQLGLTPARPLVVYCNSGREASQLWFTLRALLGIEAQVYDGSWVEWSALGCQARRGKPRRECRGRTAVRPAACPVRERTAVRPTACCYGSEYRSSIQMRVLATHLPRWRTKDTGGNRFGAPDTSPASHTATPSTASRTNASGSNGVP